MTVTLVLDPGAAASTIRLIAALRERIATLETLTADQAHELNQLRAKAATRTSA